MNKKIVSKYIYEGLGFPLELYNIEMIKHDGEWHPKIDVRKVADKAIKSLVLQKSRLTGSQVKFIRQYFSKSLREFAEVVNESHAAIKKWEDFKDKPTNMDCNIEIVLRLYIYNQVLIKSKNDRVKFYDQYVCLTEMFADERFRRGEVLQKIGVG